MRFGNPQMLWLMAITLPLLLAFLGWAWRKRQVAIRQFVQSRLLAQLTVGVSVARQKLRLALMAVAVGLVFLALARPQYGFELEEVRQKGLDIVVAVDTSRSMLAEDVKPNRLARTKLEITDLIRKAKSDRLGLVGFAGTAFLQCPLTRDDEAFRQSVGVLEVGIVPQGGTAIGEAIRAALGAFKEDGDHIKVMILFTDGEDHEGRTMEAAKEAAQQGMRIYTIGVGTPEGELLRQQDESGRVSYIQDGEGNNVRSRLDETALREIAAVTHGVYLPLRGAQTMAVLYDKVLSQLPKAELAAKPLRFYHERFQWPLLLAMLVLLAEMFLPERRRVARSESVPGKANPGLRKALALLLALLLPSAAFSPSTNASPRIPLHPSRGPIAALGASGKASRAYEKGNYEGALEEYQRLQRKRPNDPRVDFNAGAAAYRAGEFERAMTNFSHTVTSPEAAPQLQEHAYYNLGNTLYRAGEAAADDQQKRAAWEQAVRHYESALKLDEKDADAQYNLEFVRKKLEELKQQQQQSHQDQKQPDDQDQQKRKDQEQDQQDQKNQDQQDQQEKSAQQQKQPQPEEQPSDRSDQPDQDKQQDSRQNDENQDKDRAESQAQSAPQPEKPDGEPDDPKDGQPATPLGQMTREQALQLLEALKDQEKAWIFKPPQKGNPRDRRFKDW